MLCGWFRGFLFVYLFSKSGCWLYTDNTLYISALLYFKISHVLKQNLTSFENFPQYHFEIDFTNIFIDKA